MLASVILNLLWISLSLSSLSSLGNGNVFSFECLDFLKISSKHAFHLVKTAQRRREKKQVFLFMYAVDRREMMACGRFTYCEYTVSDISYQFWIIHSHRMLYTGYHVIGKCNQMEIFIISSPFVVAQPVLHTIVQISICLDTTIQTQNKYMQQPSE